MEKKKKSDIPPKQVMAEKGKMWEKGKSEKQMEGLKEGRNGSKAQVGWTDGCLGG